jgi:radical SAM protein (TIGR01212 family)
MIEPPYLTYARYLTDRHGCIVYRVAVDAGFSCPNRPEGRSSRGCTYCAEEGGRAPYLSAASRTAVETQVQESIAFLRSRYRAEAFILFFQAFSNTNAPVAKLREIYDHGLSLAPFVGLNVATRPDCLDAEKTDLLASYRSRGLEVWAELGLQTSDDITLRRVARGHTAEDFLRAYQMLKDRGVKVAVHLIFGLPGEDMTEIMRTMEFVARLEPDGVKIHNLHIPDGTVLAEELQKGELTAPTAPRHLEYVIAAIERLPPATVIMRLTCDTPEERLAAPRHFWPKGLFLERLSDAMQARGARQGRLFAPAAH